jgi:glyoxylase-like metal-dependent hydrolase (beta-lactamase superfamily II)
MAGVEGVYGKERARKMYGKPDPDPGRAHHRGPRQHRAQARLARTAVHRRAGPCQHHIAIVDRQSSGIFTGDTFGISYRELDVDGRPLIFPSSTPIQFDPDEMRASIERMLSFNPDAVYLTHFSRLAPPAELGRRCCAARPLCRHRAGGQRG